MKASFQKDNIPAYIGVYNSLYSDIVNGAYRPGERLPGEVALAEKYNVSRNTLRQALAILNEDGLIIKSQGKDTTIAPTRESGAVRAISNPMTECAKLPVTGTRITYNYGSPTDIAKSHLHLGDSDLVLASNCVYSAEGQIVGYAFTQIPTKYFSELGLNTAQDQSIEEVTTRTVFRYAASAALTVKLIFANEMEVEFLEVPPETPLLLLEDLLCDSRGEPFCRCKFYILPEYYHLSYTLTQ